MHRMLLIAAISVILLSTVSFVWGEQDSQEFIKRPNVSGRFYSANPKQLSSDVDKLFDLADIKPLEKKINILIAPHAGYIYSGGVAAYGYKALKNQSYGTVVVLAPSHFFSFSGASVWPKGAFETPLGKIEVDESLANKIISYDKSISFTPQAFAREHSLEVQLPFLQKTFSDFKIVPIVIGQRNLMTCHTLASALIKAIGKRDDVLIVASSDMSHHKSDAIARAMDDNTLKIIKDKNVNKLWNQSLSGSVELCGLSPVATVLLYAASQGVDGIEVLKYANSSDTTGDKRNVVGYSSIILYRSNDKLPAKIKKGVDPLNTSQKKRLIEIAKKTIESFVRTKAAPDFDESDPRLMEEEGAFVTIHKHGRLRGCIGNVLGRGPLYLTVKKMAIEAASRDSRFNPVVANELSDIDIEVSVLSKPWRITDISEFKAGVHGVIIRKGLRQGLFLPQVATEFDWNEEEFLSNLCAHKAGLPPDAWKDPGTTIELFTADVFSEKDFAQ